MAFGQAGVKLNRNQQYFEQTRYASTHLVSYTPNNSIEDEEEILRELIDEHSDGGVNPEELLERRELEGLDLLEKFESAYETNEENRASSRYELNLYELDEEDEKEDEKEPNNQPDPFENLIELNFTYVEEQEPEELDEAA